MALFPVDREVGAALLDIDSVPGTGIYAAGLRWIDGAVAAVEGGTASRYVQGLALDADGAVLIRVVDEMPADAIWQNGFPIDMATGEILCQYAEAASWSNGLPFTESGALSVSFANWTPAYLYRHGEIGAWYDPSDLSTMFQDANGTIPAAVDQPVGLVLDKSMGLVRGPELGHIGTAINSGDSSITLDDASTGTWTFKTITSSGGVLRPQLQFTGYTPGKFYRFRFEITSVSGTPTRWRLYTGTEYVFTSTPLEAGNYEFTILANSPTIAPWIAIDGENKPFEATMRVSMRELPGNHASQPTSTARPILRESDGRMYLEFDGIDDFLSTGNIDFTGTDKMTVVAGVHKASDATNGALLDVGFSGAGYIYIRAPFGSTDAYGMSLRGTGAAFGAYVTGFAAPNTATLVFQTDLAGATGLEVAPSPFINGVQQPTGTGAWNPVGQGGGTHPNAPIFFGARSDASNFFNGHIYSLIVRGAKSTLREIETAEVWVNDRTGAY